MSLDRDASNGEIKKEICIVDCESLEILYTNTVDMDYAKSDSSKMYCYERLKNQTSPCKNCPLKEKKDSEQQDCEVAKKDTAKSWAVIQRNDVHTTEIPSLWWEQRNVNRVINNIQALIFFVIKLYGEEHRPASPARLRTKILRGMHRVWNVTIKECRSI